MGLKVAKRSLPSKTGAASSGNEAIERWQRFETKVRKRGLDWALHRAPAQLRQARSLRHPRGAIVSHLLPASYRQFVAEVGYPVFGTSYYDRAGFSFLPMEAIENYSLGVFDSEGNEAAAKEEGAPTRAGAAFFAGYDLSDIEGFAFAPLSDGRLGVWLVERCMATEELGSFEDWLDGTLGDLERYIDTLSEGDLERLKEDSEGENDPHRLIDYSLSEYDSDDYSEKDLKLHWVESQSKTPYLRGLVNDKGDWLIPMTQDYLSVRSFRDGVAEVILNNKKSSYAGPWVKISTDGRLVGTTGKKVAAKKKSRSRVDDQLGCAGKRFLVVGALMETGVSPFKKHLKKLRGKLVSELTPELDFIVVGNCSLMQKRLKEAQAIAKKHPTITLIDLASWVKKTGFRRSG